MIAWLILDDRAAGVLLGLALMLLGTLVAVRRAPEEPAEPSRLDRLDGAGRGQR